MLLAYLAFLLSCCHTADNQQINNYGPYTISCDKMEICKGPKPVDCGKIDILNTQNISDVIFRLNFPNDCLVTMGKISMSTLKNDKKNKLMNYALNKPCQHFVLGAIFKESLNITDDCKIHKGLYEIHVDIREQSRKFLGTNFFYGTYLFKSIAYNKNSNFFCLDTMITVNKTS